MPNNSSHLDTADIQVVTITSLVKTINAHLEKAKQYDEKSEQHYISAGLHLAELKDRYKQDVKASKTQTWEEFVRETFGLGRSRADELIRIASGQTTVAETRADTAKRVQKHSSAKKPPLANGGSGNSGSVTVFADAPQPMNTIRLNNQLMALSWKLEKFGEDYFAGVREWCAAHPTMPDHFRHALTGMLEHFCFRMQTLVQEIEGRNSDDNDEAASAPAMAPDAGAGS